MKDASLAIYIVVTVVMAVTTFLSPMVYGTWWFVAMWGMFAAVLVCGIIWSRMWRKAGALMMHLSFLAMLGGGLLTYLTQEKGMVRIGPGETATEFAGPDGSRYPLPEGVTLKSFEVKYYPGGGVPEDYISRLSIGGEDVVVSMNHIYDLRGYRLLQASYDDEGGTVLSVNHDPYGIPLSYAGYALFAVSGLWMLLNPRGRFRSLMRSVGVVMLLMVGCHDSMASKIDGIPREKADSLRSKEVLYNGRIVTFNTLARDVVTKIHGKPTYRGLTPEQTLVSLQLFPEVWKNQPLILVKDKGVAKALGIKGKYVSLSSLFDSVGTYKVEPLYYSLGVERRRAIEELDEKVGIILSLYTGGLIVNPPADAPHLSQTHIALELFYNSFPFTLLLFIILFLGFISGMAGLLGFRHGHGMALCLLAVSLALSAGCFALHWYLSGRIPLANIFETMQFVVLAMEIITLMAVRGTRLILPLAMLMTGALALVAHLIKGNPMVTPLMPVLHSGWLSLHVSLVMTAYAILGFTFVVSVAALLRPSAAPGLSRLTMALLYPGVWLLGLGIFSGAVWANVSWGQYWSWDPKETWALITLFVYTLPLHTSFNRLHPFFTATGKQHGYKLLNIYMLLASLSIAMTYFGVNYLNSLHAYN